MSSDLIGRALRRFLTPAQAMRRDAETLPVSVAQSAVLSRLRGGPKTVGKLATAEGVRAPSMTQIINRMEEAGWVIRSEGQVRGRAVQITEVGRAVAVAVRQERTARLAKRCDGLSAEDLASLEAVLPVLDRIFGDPAELLRRRCRGQPVERRLNARACWASKSHPDRVMTSQRGARDG